MVGPIGALRNSTHTCEVWGRCARPRPPPPRRTRGAVRGAAARADGAWNDRKGPPRTRYLDMRTPMAPPMPTHDTARSASSSYYPDRRRRAPAAARGPRGRGRGRLRLRLRATARTSALADFSQTSPLRSKLKKLSRSARRDLTAPLHRAAARHRLVSCLQELSWPPSDEADGRAQAECRNASSRAIEELPCTGAASPRCTHRPSS